MGLISWLDIIVTVLVFNLISISDPTQSRDYSLVVLSLFILNEDSQKLKTQSISSFENQKRTLTTQLNKSTDPRVWGLYSRP